MIISDVDRARTSVIGRMAAATLDLVPANVVVPVLSGPLMGMRWIRGSSVHSCWLGLYERDKLIQMRDHIQKGHVVYDIGAQAGYHTLMAARLVGPEGKVYAFEPLPRNADFLTRNVTLNSLDSVTVVRAAVSKENGTASFDPGAGFMSGHLAGNGPIAVEVVAVDSWRARTGARPPNFMKLDVEGEEKNVLMGAIETIRQFRPVIALDTHDFCGGNAVGVHNACCQLLRDWDYDVMEDPLDDPLFARHVIAVPR